jgi:hypothetical protein
VVLAGQNAQAILSDIIQQLSAGKMAIPKRNTTMFGQIQTFRCPKKSDKNWDFSGPDISDPELQVLSAQSLQQVHFNHYPHIPHISRVLEILMFPS